MTTRQSVVAFGPGAPGGGWTTWVTRVFSSKSFTRGSAGAGERAVATRSSWYRASRPVGPAGTREAASGRRYRPPLRRVKVAARAAPVGVPASVLDRTSAAAPTGAG